MATSHKFGGSWTEDKLTRVRKYLDAYMQIFSKNPSAAKFDTWYVDAFAGTGYRTPAKASEKNSLLLLDDEDAESFQKGSVHVALETNPSFTRYVFIENNTAFIPELEKSCEAFPDLKQKISIVRAEANTYLKRWCKETNWSKNRAVVFIDPYGMQVEWETIATLGKTKAIDLWLLFPLGIGVNRLLMRSGPPEGPWADRLTLIFGTDEWKTDFYTRRLQSDLFGNTELPQKDADFDKITRFFVERLKTEFAGVADNPLPLRNSRNTPIYLLCFAAANLKGATTAVKIAQNILKK